MPEDNQVLPPSPPEAQPPQHFDSASPKKSSNAGLWIGLGVGCGVGGLALVGILIGLLLPAVMRVKGHAANCQSNLRQIGLAINAYSEDFDGEFPPSLKELYPDYVANARLFKCPATNSEGWRDFTIGTVTERSSSYVYLPGRFNELPGDFIVAYDKPENHKGEGANAVFVDGHVQWYKATPASSLMKELADQEARLPELRKKWEEQRKAGNP